MNVRRASWHARVYLWWHMHKYGEAADNANLCPYVRTVLFWAPLRFLFTDWATKWLPICVWPVFLYGVPKLLGWLSYDVKLVLWIIELATACTATCFFAVIVNQAYKDRDRNLYKTLGDWWTQSEERALLVAYGRAGHDRFCPEITLRSETDPHEHSGDAA